MRRSQSMESLPMLPEEAKMAASLLRLTLSDKQETSTESEFQSYMTKNSHFPYHKAVPIKIVHQKSEAIPIRGSEANVTFRKQVNTQRPRTLRQRCESSPSAVTREDVKVVNGSSSCLSQSAPTENQGFFQRLFPSFMKRRSASEKKTDENTSSPMIVTTVRSSEKVSKESESGHFVRQLTRMDNLIFMSMR